MNKKYWFTDWFNTPYYHTLYKHRNDIDAQLFMKNITAFLSIPKTTHILDLPCGKGRHSVFLNSLGYKVTGGDLAENSIKFAQQFGRLIVVTRGEIGSVAINKDKVIECQSKKGLKIKDLTGAGDLFAAGYLHGHINNLSIRESLEKGTDLSSKIIQQIGAILI